MKAIKNALGGTLNDAVLAAVSLATGRWMRARRDTRPTTSSCGRWCRCPCAPTSSAAPWATASPRSTRRCPSASTTRPRRFAYVTRRWATSRRSGQAVGATTLTALADFAPTDDPQPGRAAADAASGCSTSS